MTQTGLPQSIKGTLDASGHSEAVSAAPLRSRHEGHMRLTLTDGEGKQSIANLDIKVSGDSDGSPTQGLGAVLTRFLNAASLMTPRVPRSDDQQ
jgi:hypothetical protein